MCISVRILFYWRKEIKSGNHFEAPKKKKEPQNKLKQETKKEIVEVLSRKEWSDFSPREIYYKLLDEESKIIASVSSFYRVAREENLMVRRSKTSSRVKLNRETPHLLARGPNEIWSWDVSQIASTSKTVRYYLYVIMDIWSRYVVAWKLEECEQTDHAILLWKEALESQVITGRGLVNHKDNGSIMTADAMIKFVRDAEMVDSYSRAGVSDDNPFSESLFRTIKYFRDYPDYFEILEGGRVYFKKYFNDYNFEFRHSGIQFIAPGDRHYGEESKILEQRNKVIAEFYKANSNRYSKGPKIFNPIKEVKIN
jgi:transposase InsO family protein